MRTRRQIFQFQMTGWQILGGFCALIFVFAMAILMGLATQN